jgi:nicotinate-nucleotide adenylyltransferase
VLGGTFNPIHNGHLRSAVELLEQLGLERLHLMPCARPPHREAPRCPAMRRADMVTLAVAGEPRLCCDRRELTRTGPSYTVTSLAELRAEYGPRTGLCLVMGCDALLGLPRWHHWQELLDYAHIVIIARPGWALPQAGELLDWLDRHRLQSAAQLRRAPAGGVLLLELSQLAISSTGIRALRQAGRSARYLLPDSVLDYIERHQLYTDAADTD